LARAFSVVNIHLMRAPAVFRYFSHAVNSPGLGGRECLIEGTGRVGRQVVLDDPDARGIGIMDIDEFAHALSVVFCHPPLGVHAVVPHFFAAPLIPRTQS
jgi:hypothetical protein